MYAKKNTLKSFFLSSIFKTIPNFYVIALFYIFAFYGVSFLVAQTKEIESVPIQSMTPHTSEKAVLIVNGESTENYLTTSLKKKGYVLINIITPSSNLNLQEVRKSGLYNEVLSFQDNISGFIESLKSLLETKKFTLCTVLTLNQNDNGFVDSLREAFAKPFNGEAFRTFHQNKNMAIKHLNTLLKSPFVGQEITIKEFEQAIHKQKLPCHVSVIKNNQRMVSFLIEKTGDIVDVQKNLTSYNTSDIKLWLQPYFSSVYRLQVHSVENSVTVVGIWLEEMRCQNGQIQIDKSTFFYPSECPNISTEKLNHLARQFIEGIYLKNGAAELVFTLDSEKQPAVLDYTLGFLDLNRVEVMTEILGYSPLSYCLNELAVNNNNKASNELPLNITHINLSLNDKVYLQKITSMPTFYKYYEDKTNSSSLETRGELYLAHPHKDLMQASYGSIRNIEQLLLNSQFSTHSATQIADFYRTAALNKRRDYSTISKENEPISHAEEHDLNKVRHNSEHIPKYIKPLNQKATIQDIMRYYIDIYDLYILHGNPVGKSAIAMNTGNPAFLPFTPIVDALTKSLENNLLTYARYSFQVPEVSFVNKIARYCKEENLLASHHVLHPRNVIIGHGSTNVYYLALKSIIKNKGDVVLVTRPTYGLFIDPIYTADGDVGFIDIKEEAGWKVEPNVLEETIKFYNQKVFNTYLVTTFIKAYHHFLHAQKVFNLDPHSLPAIPAIKIDTKLNVFDDYITKLNTYIDSIDNSLVNKEELKFQLPPRVRAFYHMNPHNPTGALYTQKDIKALAKVIKSYPDIYIIEDLAHWGVTYDDKMIPTTFSSLNDMFNQTLLFLSLSKSYCVPGLRAGVTIGEEKIITEMQYRLLNSTSSATLPAIIALEAVMDAPKKERDTYLKSNSDEYFYRRNLMGTLVNGSQNTLLTFEQKIKIYQQIIESEYKEGEPLDQKLINFMLSGMPLVRTLTDPKGCFFHLLDISKLIGSKIGETELQTATDVRNAIYSICNVDMVPGEISGNFFNYSLRMSFSLTPKEIYFACKNIHVFIVNHIIKHNPTLIEKWYTVNGSSLKINKEVSVDEAVFHKAFIRLSLSKVRRALNEQKGQLIKDNHLKNQSSIQEHSQKIAKLDELMLILLNPSLIKTVHQEIQSFLNKNKTWMKVHLKDMELLEEMNQKMLN